MKWPEVLYDFGEYGVERLLLPKSEAQRTIMELRRLGPDWKRLRLKDIPVLYHEKDDVYRYGTGTILVRVKEAGFPYQPMTYTIVEVLDEDEED